MRTKNIINPRVSRMALATMLTTTMSYAQNDSGAKKKVNRNYSHPFP